jgi:uncharacterized protein YgbK (DUF1537 family)
VGHQDSFHAALHAATSVRVWRVVGILVVGASGWATWAVHEIETSAGAAPPSSAPSSADAPPPPAAVAIAALSQRLTTTEQAALTCKEQSALALQEMVGLSVTQSARGNAMQRAAAAAAAKRRFKRALVDGSTFEQAIAEAVGGGGAD